MREIIAAELMEAEIAGLGSSTPPIGRVVVGSGSGGSPQDELVAVDADAIAGYLGAAQDDGVLRVDAPITYTDGGDTITLGIDQSAIDHGNLAGLADDDHPQYLKEKASGGLASETPTHTHQDAANCGQLDHGLALTGLGDDDHTQYALLAGRADGQTLSGGSASGEGMQIRSTSHATKGVISIGDAGEVVVDLNPLYDTVFIRDAAADIMHQFATTAGIDTVLNDAGIDSDTVIKGDTDPNLVKVDAGLDKVGFGVGTPAEKVHSSDKVRADTCFNANGSDGISQVIMIRDVLGQNHMLTFTGGILTAYSVR